MLTHISNPNQLVFLTFSVPGGSWEDLPKHLEQHSTADVQNPQGLSPLAERVCVQTMHQALR